jgi:hypothetical protein
MFKLLLFAICLSLSCPLAQLTYSDTPSSEDLEHYFFGGMRLLEVKVPSRGELRYQMINMKDMETLWSGSTGNLVNTAPDGFTARFSFAISDFFAEWCTIRFEQLNADAVKFEFFQARLSVDVEGSETSALSDGFGDCIYFDSSFNWGHWTNILVNYTEPLPREGWIPALAFVPNFLNSNAVEYGSAETWLVLLVTFDDLNYGANPNELSQEEVINLLQDYGIDTTP